MNRIILFFIDGIGITTRTPHNPINIKSLKAIGKVVSKAKPIDACMGVTGLPQSATGQASLFCGINAQKIVGRHIEGFPNLELRTLIEKQNLFHKLLEKRKKPTFANGYWISDIHHLTPRQQRMRSVTTVMTLSALGNVRGMEEMKNGRAVYQDITHEYLHSRDASVPRISPALAAERLLEISKEHDFTLYEYFQTDRASHSRDPERCRQVLTTLNAFLHELLLRIDFKTTLFCLTSDHGNIEDLSTRGHTRNPVPWFVRGPGADDLRKQVTSLSDITPAIINWFDRH